MTRTSYHLPVALVGIALVALGFMTAHPVGLASIVVGVATGAPALLFLLAEVSA